MKQRGKGPSGKPFRSPAAQRVTATLTYLSTGFDWASNYVARVREDGKTLDLFAWLTVANSNGESFADAGQVLMAALREFRGADWGEAEVITRRVDATTDKPPVHPHRPHE